MSHEVIPEDREVCNAYGYHSVGMGGKKSPKLLSVRSYEHPA